jgi:hypothetical protein
MLRMGDVREISQTGIAARWAKPRLFKVIRNVDGKGISGTETCRPARERFFPIVRRGRNF